MASKNNNTIYITKYPKKRQEQQKIKIFDYNCTRATTHELRKEFTLISENTKLKKETILYITMAISNPAHKTAIKYPKRCSVILFVTTE